MQALRHYLLAVQFFTRIPITGRLADVGGLTARPCCAPAVRTSRASAGSAAVATASYAALALLLAPSPWASAVAAWWRAVQVATVLLTGGFS